MLMWTLDNLIDDLIIVSNIFDDDEMVVRDENTGKIIWEGRKGDYWRERVGIKNINKK